jgi:hypothetical protein
MEMEEGLQLLLASEKVDSEQKTDAESIVRRLGYLLLATSGDESFTLETSWLSMRKGRETSYKRYLTKEAETMYNR